jgi:hypothetical protein
LSLSSAGADGASLVSLAACAAAGCTLAPNIASGKINPTATLAIERQPRCARRAQRDSARISFSGKRKSFIDSVPIDKSVRGYCTDKNH